MDMCRFTIASLLLVAGCSSQPDAASTRKQPAEPSKDAVQPDDAAATPSDGDPTHAPESTAFDSEWNDRNADIYRYLFAQLTEPTPNRINFITTTPMEEWGETGKWSTIPSDKLESMPVAATHLAADKAYLKDGHVLEKGTDAKAWMKWISVKKWINENEVEVEEGVWCCPLGGGGSTTIYTKINGNWQVKKTWYFLALLKARRTRRSTGAADRVGSEIEVTWPPGDCERHVPGIVSWVYLTS